MKPPLTPVPCARRTEPRDGGVLSCANARRYSVYRPTDVGKTFRAEQRRLEREAAAAPAQPIATVNTLGSVLVALPVNRSRA